jgi:hypothetical protein
MSVLVKYTETPDRSYDYLVEVGYWNGIVNLRTYAPDPKPLTINRIVASKAEAEHVLAVIAKQYSHEGYAYEVTESVDSLA